MVAFQNDDEDDDDDDNDNNDDDYNNDDNDDEDKSKIKPRRNQLCISIPIIVYIPILSTHQSQHGSGICDYTPSICRGGCGCGGGCGRLWHQ